MINGIEFLKKMYPNLDDENYQPSGLDLNLGNVYEINNNHKENNFGLYLGGKKLPELVETKIDEQQKKVGHIGWTLEPNKVYLCEVDRQIRIGDNNAQFYLPRSSLLRSGVNVYTALGDTGYNGFLRFMVINHNEKPFFLEKGVRFAQLIDFEVKGASELYDGDYQEKESWLND